jgi:hypothetical protein
MVDVVRHRMDVACRLTVRLELNYGLALAAQLAWPMVAFFARVAGRYQPARAVPPDREDGPAAYKEQYEGNADSYPSLDTGR